MENNDKSSSKRQTEILTAVSLLILAGIFIYIALSSPRISNDYTVSVSETKLTSPSFSSDKNNTRKNSVNEDSSEKTFEESNTVVFPVNLNTCSASDLMQIENIGEARANAIVAYRDEIGGYTSVDQLKNISGTGESVFSSIKPYVTV
ncbi:MAG: helix-hairpin-helix domain-containing protein [Clostridiales bacterium]|nr:helix-hairpin-helix domain-containing protein [Clostridiales bacterium]